MSVDIDILTHIYESDEVTVGRSVFFEDAPPELGLGDVLTKNRGVWRRRAYLLDDGENFISKRVDIFRGFLEDTEIGEEVTVSLADGISFRSALGTEPILYNDINGSLSMDVSFEKEKGYCIYTKGRWEKLCTPLLIFDEIGKLRQNGAKKLMTAIKDVNIPFAIVEAVFRTTGDFVFVKFDNQSSGGTTTMSLDGPLSIVEAYQGLANQFSSMGSFRYKPPGQIPFVRVIGLRPQWNWADEDQEEVWKDEPQPIVEKKTRTYVDSSKKNVAPPAGTTTADTDAGNPKPPAPQPGPK